MSRDVSFHETVFPFSDVNMKSSSEVCVPLPTDGTGFLYDRYNPHNIPAMSRDGWAAEVDDRVSSGYNFLTEGDQETSSHAEHNGQNEFPRVTTSQLESSAAVELPPPGQSVSSMPLDSQPSQEQSSGQPAMDSQLGSQTRQEQLQPIAPALRRSNRGRVTPGYLKDYHCSVLKNPPSNSCVQMAGSPHALSTVIGYDGISGKHKNFILSVTCAVEPRCYNEAIKHADWRDAMKQELEALEANSTWVIVDLPPGKQPIVSGCTE